MSNQIKVEVASICQVAPTIREFTLEAIDDALYPFSPGAHVVVEMPNKKKVYKNAYSLLSDPTDTQRYRIAVRLQDASRGGSIYMHEQVKVGDQLLISPPSNLFSPLWHAKKHVMLAGGVGVTPFMSYIPEMIRRDADFELHYMYRSLQTGAYKHELSEQLGDKYFDYDSDRQARCDVTALLSQQPLGTHIYICGPDSLIQAVEEAAQTLGLPASVIHSEEFAAPKPGMPFVAEIKSTGQQVDVSAEDSLLEALEASDISIPNLCRGGVCGQCVCTVVEGEIDHRDQYLSDEEKAAGNTIMPCVSRAAGERLVLDI
jgi:ferredoxin-NADP reductase